MTVCLSYIHILLHLLPPIKNTQEEANEEHKGREKVKRGEDKHQETSHNKKEKDKGGEEEEREDKGAQKKVKKGKEDQAQERRNHKMMTRSKRKMTVKKTKQ